MTCECNTTLPILNKLKMFLVVWRASWISFLWLAISFEVQGQEASGIAVQWRTNANPLVVEVTGLNSATLAQLQNANLQAEGWQKLLSIHVAQDNVASSASLPGMLGSYSLEGGVIRFQPQFPLERGVKYRAVFRPISLPGNSTTSSSEIVSTFQLKALQQKPSTVVAQVYPSSDVLPENLLKFYVHFSAPMQGGRIYDHIHLLDGKGRAVDLPFLELDEELWSPEMTRLTLFIDPGRIKRGVKPLEDIGPALEAGGRYTLVIDADWHDGSGLPLRESYRKSFRVSAADRKPLTLKSWKIKSPKAGTAEPLIVNFGKPMDHALALRVISVAYASGKILSGTSDLSDNEKRWQFVPQQPWQKGAYQLRVQNTIEDLAGNNIGKSFEMDLAEGTKRRFTNAIVSLAFEAR
jgi:hypothetical protein